MQWHSRCASAFLRFLFIAYYFGDRSYVDVRIPSFRKHKAEYQNLHLRRRGLYQSGAESASSTVRVFSSERISLAQGSRCSISDQTGSKSLTSGIIRVPVSPSRWSLTIRSYKVKPIPSIHLPAFYPQSKATWLRTSSGNYV